MFGISWYFGTPSVNLPRRGDVLGHVLHARTLQVDPPPFVARAADARFLALLPIVCTPHAAVIVDVGATQRALRLVVGKEAVDVALARLPRDFVRECTGLPSGQSSYFPKQVWHVQKFGPPPSELCSGRFSWQPLG